MTRRRPTIGVTTARRGGRFMWWFNRLAVWRAGGRAVRILPGADRPVHALDGLIVGGGDDIGAALYGGEVVLNVRVDHDRDRLEQSAVWTARARGVPVLGICRGAQMINVVYGGSLHTDIYEVYEAAPRMRTILPRKTIRVASGSILEGILTCSVCRVNALHHQSMDRIGHGLQVVARDDYGIVQAIEGTKASLTLGVQWHPEFLVFDRGQQNLFRTLVEAAADTRAARDRHRPLVRIAHERGRDYG